eukprot:7521406-Pyramimonas_sp.AAC.1
MLTGVGLKTQSVRIDDVSLTMTVAQESALAFSINQGVWHQQWKSQEREQRGSPNNDPDFQKLPSTCQE